MNHIPAAVMSCDCKISCARSGLPDLSRKKSLFKLNLNLFQTLCQRGRLKSKQQRVTSGVCPHLFTPGSRSQLIPLVARSLFRSSSLTESPEQATEYTETDAYESREIQQMYRLVFYRYLVHRKPNGCFCKLVMKKKTDLKVLSE